MIAPLNGDLFAAVAGNSIDLVRLGGVGIGTTFTLLALHSIYILLGKEHCKDSTTVPAPSISVPFSVSRCSGVCRLIRRYPALVRRDSKRRRRILGKCGWIGRYRVRAPANLRRKAADAPPPTALPLYQRQGKRLNR